MQLKIHYSGLSLLNEYISQTLPLVILFMKYNELEKKNNRDILYLNI